MSAAQTAADKESIMNIGQAAQASGVSAKMIRYYEGIGLIPKADRTGSGYRVYSEREASSLRFIRRARDLGFSVEQIGDLLALWRDRERASADVKQLALERVAVLEGRVAQLLQICETLRHLAEHCHGDERPECPIIDGLAEVDDETPATQPHAVGMSGARNGRERRAATVRDGHCDAHAQPRN